MQPLYFRLGEETRRWSFRIETFWWRNIHHQYSSFETLFLSSNFFFEVNKLKYAEGDYFDFLDQLFRNFRDSNVNN